MKIRNLLMLGLSLAGMGLSACNYGGSVQGGQAGAMNDNLFQSLDAPGPAEDLAILKAPCKSNADQLCLALKYVVYKNANDEAVVRQRAALANLASINQVWEQCHVGFQIDEYLAIDPKDYGLRYQTANAGELSTIRRTFQDRSHLLVVTTGTWDRSGSLGNTGANAWTSMPGEGQYGVVLEKPVGTFANIIAHELGHYLNLLHAGASVNLMNPIIYDTSKQLSKSQCAEVRRAVSEYWQKMLR